MGSRLRAGTGTGLLGSHRSSRRLVPARSYRDPVTTYMRTACYMGTASYTSIVPPPVSTGQPLANAAASLSESAVTTE